MTDQIIAEAIEDKPEITNKLGPGISPGGAWQRGFEKGEKIQKWPAGHRVRMVWKPCPFISAPTADTEHIVKEYVAEKIYSDEIDGFTEAFVSIVNRDYPEEVYGVDITIAWIYAPLGTGALALLEVLKK